MTACTPGCGFCGRCTAGWDDDDAQLAPTLCTYCSVEPVSDEHDPYCSTQCVANAEADNDDDR